MRYLVVDMCKVCAMQETRRCQLRGKRLVKRQPARALDYVLDLHSYAQAVTALLGQTISRCQQRSKRLLSNAAARTLNYVLDLQYHVQLITAALGSLTHAAASWLVSAGAAGCRRCSCICACYLRLLARPAAWQAKRAAARAAAAAANSSRGNEQLAACAQQQPAGRRTPTKRRQQCNSPAPGAAATAKPGRQARRRLRNRAAAAQNTMAAAADIEHTATAAPLHINKAPEQGNEAVADAADMEHSTMPTEQLQGGPELFAAEMYAAIKPSSVAEVRDSVTNRVAESMS